MSDAHATVPAAMLDLFEEPALGHVAYTSAEGKLVVWPMWVALEDGVLKTSSPVGAKKGRALGVPGAPVAVSIVSTTSPWRWITATGRVREVHPDENLAFIDRLSRRYTGNPYMDRERAREVFVIELDRVSHSTGAW